MTGEEAQKRLARYGPNDTTGTLTSGETQLQAYLDLSHQASDRVLLFGNLNCAYDTGIKSPLDEAILQYGKVNTQGYRALAVAYRLVPQAAHYSVADEQNMTLLGYLTFADPPKPDAVQVLQALKNDGVQVKS